MFDTFLDVSYRPLHGMVQIPIPKPIPKHSLEEVYNFIAFAILQSTEKPREDIVLKNILSQTTLKLLVNDIEQNYNINLTGFVGVSKIINQGLTFEQFVLEVQKVIDKIYPPIIGGYDV